MYDPVAWMNANFRFLIDGEVYDVVDSFEPDPSVGIFGEAGYFVARDDAGEINDEDMKFVTDDEHRVFLMTEGTNNWDTDSGLFADRKSLEWIRTFY